MRIHVDVSWSHPQTAASCQFHFVQIHSQYSVVKIWFTIFSHFPSRFPFSWFVILIGGEREVGGGRVEGGEGEKMWCVKSIFKTIIDQKGILDTQDLLPLSPLFCSIFIRSPTGKDQVSFSIWHRAHCNIDDMISIMIIRYPLTIMWILFYKL